MRILLFTLSLLTMMSSPFAFAGVDIAKQSGALLACSALFYVMTAEPSISEKATLMSQATTDVALVHFAVLGVSMTNGDITDIKEEAFSLYEQQHKNGGYGSLNAMFGLCSEWAMKISAFTSSDQAPVMKQAIQQKDIPTIQALLQDPLAQPSLDNVSAIKEGEQWVRHAFDAWATNGYITPRRAEKKLRDELRQ